MENILQYKGFISPYDFHVYTKTNDRKLKLLTKLINNRI